MSSLMLRGGSSLIRLMGVRAMATNSAMATKGDPGAGAGKPKHSLSSPKKDRGLNPTGS